MEIRREGRLGGGWLVAIAAMAAAGCSPAMSGVVATQMGRAVPMNPMSVQPSGPKPPWALAIDPQMQAVVEQLDAFKQPPLETLSAFQARNTKSATDAVMALLMKTGMPPMPPRVDVAHRVLKVGPPEGILVRTYTPMGAAGPLPVIVYYHGGGWVIADLNTYEPSAKALAEKTGAMVVSVAYRQAPENRFPAAHEDAFAAYRWVVENAASMGGDPNRIATAGESAGGNLAVAVALMAKERGVKLPVHILSVYPIADGDTESPSYQQYASAKPLSRPGMQWFFQNYLRTPQDAQTPWISLTRADVNGLPPTTIINAEIDVLRSDGEELAQRMRQAGVSVEQRTIPGVTHEFFGMAAVLEQAGQAQDMAAMRLRQAFHM
jgi:acetyl esterase